MNMGGVYSKNPPGFRYDPPARAKRFIPDVDGNWPSGIPGTPGASEYIRPQGYWVNDSDWETKFRPDTSNDSILESPTNTDGFIDAQSGTVKTALPPNSRSFILGPLVDGYNYNHGYDDFTVIGYIQKDTRQFVLLGEIEGHWDTNPIYEGPDNTLRTPRLWDGTNITAYNQNFTLAMTQWFKDRLSANDFTKDFPYFYSGGVFQPPLGNQPPGSPGNMFGGNMPGTGGNGGAPGENGEDTFGSGGDPSTGEEIPQGNPEQGDPDDLDLQGLINKALLAIDIALMGMSILGILFPEPTTSAAGAAGLAALLAKLRRLKALKAAAKAGKFKFPKFPKTPKPKFPKPKFPKGKTPKPARRPDGKPFTDPTTGRPITKASPQTPTGDPNFQPGPLTGRPIPKPVTPKPVTPRTTTSGSGKTPTPKQPKFKFKNPFQSKPRGLGGGADVGATGLKKPGFDALNPNQIGPKGLHKGSKGLLSPKGGGTYSAPKVGEVGPNPLRPGTGAARYTKFGSNPLGSGGKGGTGGGVIGSVVPKGARGISRIEPQKVVSPKTFQKGSDMFNRIMKGAYPKSKAAEKIRQQGMRAGFKPGSGSIEFKNLPNLNMDFDLDFAMYLIEEILPDDEQNRRLEALTKNPKFFENLDGIIDTLEDELEISKLFVMLFGEEEEEIQESVLYESKKRILREIKQPLKEIKELPKTQKLEKYRPNFAGKYKPQNTPNVTASKQSDEMVKAKNAAGQTWRTKDKYWGGYQSQERMNVVYDNVGHGNQYFDRIVNENLSKKNIKNRRIQEHLNIIAHEKAMRQLDSTYVSPWREIKEQETLDAPNDPLYKKVAKRLNKEIDYQDKPSKKGYPNEAPPEIDPNTGMHPKYGQRYKYDKLDPQSAEAMPSTGNPEIDSNVEIVLDKKAKARKLKNLMGKK